MMSSQDHSASTFPSKCEPWVHSRGPNRSISLRLLSDSCSGSGCVSPEPAQVNI
jgi:hypothetical protein